MNENYDMVVVLTADMLEDDMVLRGTNGAEYTIQVYRSAAGGTVVTMDWGTVTFPIGHPGFLTTYELTSDFGLDPAARWSMFAADATGSIAEMPIVAPSYGTAREMADAWLRMYDHGFVQAIVVGLDIAHAWQSESAATIWDRIMGGRVGALVLSEFGDLPREGDRTSL